MPVPQDSMPRGFSYDPAHNDADPVCPMCGEREQHERGRRYASPLDVSRGTPAHLLPTMCMECTSDLDNDGPF